MRKAFMNKSDTFVGCETYEYALIVVSMFYCRIHVFNREFCDLKQLLKN